MNTIDICINCQRLEEELKQARAEIEILKTELAKVTTGDKITSCMDAVKTCEKHIDPELYGSKYGAWMFCKHPHCNKATFHVWQKSDFAGDHWRCTECGLPANGDGE